MDNSSNSMASMYEANQTCTHNILLQINNTNFLILHAIINFHYIIHLFIMYFNLMKSFHSDADLLPGSLLDFLIIIGYLT